MTPPMMLPTVKSSRTTTLRSIGKTSTGSRDMQAVYQYTSKESPPSRSVTLAHASMLPHLNRNLSTISSSTQDVELAKMHGVRGVVLSNHGGRQLDYARSPIDTLLEINERNPALTRDADFDIYIDGGKLARERCRTERRLSMGFVVFVVPLLATDAGSSSLFLPPSLRGQVFDEVPTY